MKISDLKINDKFETHSGEKFIIVPKPGKEKIQVMQVSNGKKYSINEFEKVAIWKQ